ncbi:MAG: HD domain-containing protein, partial [Bryobacteraceae bacterium]|nr:HD domain-containing protein [Bryobacteraceae bacterium]
QASRIRAIAAERVRDELNRILTDGGARYGFELLDESGLLVEILPEVWAMKGVAQPPEYHPEGDVWTHTLLMLEAMRAPSRTLAWGVLMHDVAKPPTFRVTDRIRFDGHVEMGARMAVEILGRLRQSQDDIEQVRSLVAHHLDWMNVRQMRASTLKRFLRLDRFDEHLELHRLDCLSSHRRLESYEFVRAQLEAMPVEALRPPRLISGQDLIAAGFAPGPMFREILEAIEDAQLEGRITTREEALAEALRRRPPVSA